SFSCDWSSDVCSSDLAGLGRAYVDPRNELSWHLSLMSSLSALPRPGRGTARRSASHGRAPGAPEGPRWQGRAVAAADRPAPPARSEERRVGTEWTARG